MKKHCGSSKRRPALPCGRVLVDQEVAVVQRLQAEIAELQVALGLQRGAELLHVVLQQRLVQQADLDAVLHEPGEVLGVAGGHLGLRRVLAQRLVADGVEQQAGGDEAVRRVLLDQRSRRQHHALAHLVHRHAVVEVLERGLEDPLAVDVGEAGAGLGDDAAQPRHVERMRHALVEHGEGRRLGRRGLLRLFVRPLLRAPLAVEHVGARDLVLAAAHQRQFDLVLDLLDVDRAAFGLALHQRADDGVGELRDFLAHARRRRSLAAVDGEEGLGHRDGDLGGLEADDRAVAPDHLVLREARVAGGRGIRGTGLGGQKVVGRRGRGRGEGARNLHGLGLLSESCRCRGKPRAATATYRYPGLDGSVGCSRKDARIARCGGLLTAGGRPQDRPVSACESKSTTSCVHVATEYQE